MAKKASKPKKPAKPKIPAKPNVPTKPKGGTVASQVRVRMYRQGLGDCFLITFGAGAAAKHVLIDCGTLGATTNGNAMEDIVANIKETCGNHLHALVATHEHKDHLSGFSSGKDVFGAMPIDRFWVAWTENPKDTLAQELQVYDDDLGLAAMKGIQAMRKYASQSTASGRELSRLADKADEVMKFFGDEVLAAGKFAPTIHAAMELVRTGFGKQEAEYLQPDTLIDVADWLPDFRVYVLGPPRNKKAIADTGEEGGGDLYPYPVAGIAAAADALLMAATSREDYLAGLPDDVSRGEFKDEVPFDGRFQRSDVPASAKPLYAAYVDADNAWRRIDTDWLGFSSILALQLDNRTNNTSIVLAFERIADGKVLLFPADAQRGNWQSWMTPSELEWKVTDANGTTKTVKVVDLLKRTVFYKVGHHSSHNATAKVNGLERMEQNSLVAFIPLDRAVAKAKKWNTMPTRALYKRLMEKCDGRVVRSDIGWASKGAESDFSSMFDDTEWKAFGSKQKASEDSGMVTIDKLFVDFRLA
jgi:beta-lactamase superfamily II metal-dependent hydrolase